MNSSVFEVPSQSLESFGKYGGDPGQLMLSTRNNNEFIKANVRDMAIKFKLWQHQREDDDDEAWGVDFAGESTDEGEQCSGDEELRSVGSPALPKIGNSSKLNSSSKLNAKSHVFVPKNIQQHGAKSRTDVVSITGQQQFFNNTPALRSDNEQYATTRTTP